MSIGHILFCHGLFISIGFCVDICLFVKHLFSGLLVTALIYCENPFLVEVSA